MSEQLNGNSPKLNYNDKELLYNLFYEIISEIKNCKIEIDEDEYINNIKSIQPKQLIEYLHHSIKILLKKKFEDGRELQRKEEKNTKIKKKIPFDNDYIFQLENSLQKLEEKERNYTRLIFKYKLQKEAMRNKISNLLDIEDEYEEMKSKLKYEDGRFLENDRKENEIIILRQENINLKKYISDKEKKWKSTEDNLIKKEKLILSLEAKIEQLNKKLEEKQKEINLVSSINYNNIVNSNSSYTTSIVSANKQDNGNNVENNNSHSLNLKLFELQKIKSKLYRKKQKSCENITRNDSLEQSKLYFLQKFLTIKQKNNTSLNNSCTIKIGKLPITNQKSNIKQMPLIAKNSEINKSPINILAGPYSTSSRKCSSKYYDIFEK